MILSYLLVGLGTFVLVAWFFAETRKLMMNYIVSSVIAFLLLWPLAWASVLFMCIMVLFEVFQKKGLDK